MFISTIYIFRADQLTDEFTINLEIVKEKIGHNWDVHFQNFIIGRTGIQTSIIFVEGLSDKDLIDKHIMTSLMADFLANNLVQCIRDC
jgi:spore germination protein